MLFIIKSKGDIWIKFIMENFCSLEKNRLGSECLAKNLKDRKTCGFYKKNSQIDDCRFYRFDFMCDCIRIVHNLL